MHRHASSQRCSGCKTSNSAVEGKGSSTSRVVVPPVPPARNRMGLELFACRVGRFRRHRQRSAMAEKMKYHVVRHQHSATKAFTFGKPWGSCPPSFGPRIEMDQLRCSSIPFDAPNCLSCCLSRCAGAWKANTEPVAQADCANGTGRRRREPRCVAATLRPVPPTANIFLMDCTCPICRSCLLSPAVWA